MIIQTDDVLRIVRAKAPLNVTDLVRELGLTPDKKNIRLVYSKVTRLAMDGTIKSKRVGGSRILWL